MSTINTNKVMLDRPMWEQLSFAPVIGVAGTVSADDGARYIYTYFQVSTTVAQFWRYCTWTDTWQILATPSTQTGTVNTLLYNDVSGGQWQGATYGSLYLFNGNGAVAYFYRYDIASNTWSANLGTSGVPAAFATDASLCMPSPSKFAFDTSYHVGVTRTITTSSAAIVGAVTMQVAALPEALGVGARLRFGSFNITITGDALQGSKSIQVSALSQALALGTILYLPDGNTVVLSAAALVNATSLVVYPIQQTINTGTVIKVELYAVLTAAATANATAISVAPLLYSISTSSNAIYYGNMYLVGNNSTTIYRYNLGANTWSTTSANSANPAFPLVPGTVGAGCSMRWLPMFDKDYLYIIRGGGTNNIYVYNLSTNTMTSETYFPNTETFSTGSTVATRSLGGVTSTFLIQKDVSMRVLEYNPGTQRMLPKLNQWLYPTGTAVVGDRGTCLTSPSGIEFYYLLLSSSTGFVRCALIDS